MTVQLTKHPIACEKLLEKNDMSCGAVAIFIGQVRNNNKGKKVKAIEYSAYEKMALKQMEKIVRVAKNKFKVKNILMVHRVGKLRAGEISLVVAVFSPHREEAFEALRFCVEGIKHQVPIFKKEFFSDGTFHFSGMGENHGKCCA